MNKVSINAEQQLYVIDCGDGYFCFGFANARDHANQIATKLNRSDLAFADEDYATLAGYEKYCHAVQAWSQSPLTRTTYFDPGTDAWAGKVLESSSPVGLTNERFAWFWATRLPANPGWKNTMSSAGLAARSEA